MKQLYNQSNVACFHFFVQESEEGARLHGKMLKAERQRNTARAERFRATLCLMMQNEGYGTGNGYTR